MSKREPSRQTREEINTEERGEERVATRVPLGMPRDVLSVPKEEGYVHRWINDVGSRVMRAQEGGWEFEEKNVPIGAKRVSKGNKTGSQIIMDVGNDTIAYLMKIKQEWYEEDQKKKAERVRATEEVIYGRQNAPGFYGDTKKTTKVIVPKE